MWYISSSLYLYGYFFQWEYTLIQSLQLLEEGKGFFFNSSVYSLYLYSCHVILNHHKLHIVYFCWEVRLL